MRFAQRIGPQFRFREENEIGPPVIEKAANETADVERDILMDGASRQPFVENAG